MSTKTSRLLGTFSLAGFATLMIGVMTHAAWLSQLDRQLFKLTAAKTPINTAFYKLIAQLGSPLIAILLTCALGLWVFFKVNPTTGVFIVFSQFLGSAIAEGFKLIVQRARPTQQLVADTGYSFPSGHTFCTAILVASVLLVLLPHLHDPEQQLVAVIIGLLWIALVAISRVYLRDHFGTDVIASATLAGGFWGWLIPLRRKLENMLEPLIPQSLKGSH
ncbi:phosphatase PAP2 family protein [Lacticaseibacillus porcinae]|uniref:phosphatase PAP2 family protein n=1 Tax=Lacticaseibacillus porcinae TaxID=1123687 RepID=UPI000F7AABD8|nr:phosphatase PAP2 family protein [Lacticaseibacillus porcinae]